MVTIKSSGAPLSARVGTTAISIFHCLEPSILQAGGFLDRRGKGEVNSELPGLTAAGYVLAIETWSGRTQAVALRTVVFCPSAPVLLTDNDRQYREASIGASKLLGLPREKIIGKTLDDFAEPTFKAVIPERWSAFLEQGQQEGTLQLLDPNGSPRGVEYVAKGNVSPSRHVLALGEKKSSIPAWVQDFALFLLGVDGQVVAWYAGAERIYGYKSGEIVGQRVSPFYPGEDALRKQQEQLKRAAAEGHIGAEGWQVKKDGSRFWANVITVALRDENGRPARLCQSGPRL